MSVRIRLHKNSMIIVNGYFLCFLSSADFFSQNIFFTKTLSGIPSEVQIRSDLGPNCKHKLSADDTGRHKKSHVEHSLNFH